MQTKARRKTAIWSLLIAALVTPILLIAWSFARASDWITPFENRAFDAVVWRGVSKEGHRERRAEMAHDLMRHHLKVGMSESEVTAILGPPDKNWSLFGCEPPQPQNVDEYNMGAAPFDFAGQCYVFRLVFDRHGRYQFSEITRD